MIIKVGRFNHYVHLILICFLNLEVYSQKKLVTYTVVCRFFLPKFLVLSNNYWVIFLYSICIQAFLISIALNNKITSFLIWSKITGRKVYVKRRMYTFFFDCTLKHLKTCKASKEIIQQESDFALKLQVFTHWKSCNHRVLNKNVLYITIELKIQ